MTDDDSSVFARSMVGDLDAFTAMTAWNSHRFSAASAGQVGAVAVSSVARVLRAYLTGDATQSVVQQWADLARGVMAASDGVVRFDTGWDREFEDEIATVLQRLRELGDLVDGEFLPGEGERLYRLLTSQAATPRA